jgi:hypothetical protein
MSTRQKIHEMLSIGFSKKTLLKLSESQLNLLHKRMVGKKLNEATTEYDMTKQEDRDLYKKKTGNEVTSDGKVKIQTELEEVVNRYEFSSGGKGICTSLGGEYDGSSCKIDNGDGSFKVYNFGNDKDRLAAAQGMGGKYVGGGVEVAAESYIRESKKSKKNPWAICTATMGEKFGTTERSEWTKKEKNKYEKCVLGVKEKIKEGKNPYEYIMEQKMSDIVEESLRPRMTKKDLLETIKFQKMIIEDSKTKEKTKEKEKTTTPKRRSPFQPAPNTDPAPKGAGTKEKERTKEKEKTTTPKRRSPFQPAPNTDPAPKGENKSKLPNFLKFNTLDIKFKED